MHIQNCFVLREMEAKADALAREIEGSNTNKLAIELENGDEEEAFSAVIRGGGNNRGNKMRNLS